MQVEVKLRLKDKTAHDKVVSVLQGQQKQLYRQHNYFYDGPNRELSSNKTILRMRWFNDNEKVVITMKGKMAVQDGVGRAEEDESEVDVADAKRCHADPSQILKLQLPVVEALKACALRCCSARPLHVLSGLRIRVHASLPHSTYCCACSL